uniref:Uncharacterized protein n=1 Tax=viral metagenome TaxID=1070528 RepID=A0A6H1ZYE4_9ZZZZ
MSHKEFEIHLTPTNKVAATVTSKGTHFEPKLKLAPQIITSSIPLPHYNRFPGPKRHDLTGKGIGRLTVIGYSKKGNSGMGQWVVRCDCGNYEVMKSRTIKNPKNTRTACRICMKTMWIIKKGKEQEDDA